MTTDRKSKPTGIVKKWVCIDKNNYLVYIYAPNWDSAKKQAEQKGYTLQGEFVDEHD